MKTLYTVYLEGKEKKKLCKCHYWDGRKHYIKTVYEFLDVNESEKYNVLLNENYYSITPKHLQQYKINS